MVTLIALVVLAGCVLFLAKLGAHVPAQRPWAPNRARRATVVLYVKDDESSVEDVVLSVVRRAEKWFGHAYRVVCIDMGSSDDTPRILEKLEDRLPAVAAFRLNLGKMHRSRAVRSRMPRGCCTPASRLKALSLPPTSRSISFVRSNFRRISHKSGEFSLNGKICI